MIAELTFLERSLECSTVTSIVRRERSHILSSEFVISIFYPIIILKAPLTPVQAHNQLGTPGGAK